VFVMSPEQRRFKWTNTCPMCRRLLWAPHYFRPDGIRISAWTFLSSMDKRTVANCPKCGGTWPVFVLGVSPHKRPTAGAPIQVLGVTETHRSEEPIGTDAHRMGDTSRAVRQTRTFRVTREWNRTVSVGQHDNHGINGSIQFGPNWLAVKASLEQALERTYDFSVSRREEFGEEISVEIEAGADVTIMFTWKRIWQHGLVHVLTGGHRVDVPFRMTVGVTFDQSIQ
jgi:hypothetical protein